MKLKKLQEDIATLNGLQRVSNIDVGEFRKKVNVEGLIEIISNSENGIMELNGIILKLAQRVDFLDREHFEMKREIKLQ